MSDWTYARIEKELEQIKDPQKVFDYLRDRIHNRWLPALISNVTPGVVRIQLQSASPESEDTGQIMCVIGKSLPDAVLNAILWSRRHPNPDHFTKVCDPKVKPFGEPEPKRWKSDEF